MKRYIYKLVLIAVVLALTMLIVLSVRVHKSWSTLAAVESIRQDDHEGLSRLLAGGVSPNAIYGENNFTLLIHASEYNAVKCVDVLLDYGADVNVSVGGIKAIWWTLDILTLKRLLQEPECIVSARDVGVMGANWYCHPEIAELLIAQGFDPSVIVAPATNATVLMQMAVVSDKDRLGPDSPIYKTIDILIEAGADVDSNSYGGATAAELAAWTNRPMLADHFAQLESKAGRDSSKVEYEIMLLLPSTIDPHRYYNGPQQ